MIDVSFNLFKTVPNFDECRWIALNNPNFVKYIRQDYQVLNIGFSGTTMNVSVNTLGVTQTQFELDFAVGKQVYISALDKTVIVTLRTYSGSGLSFFRFVDTISYSGQGGYANCFSRVGYYMEIIYVKVVDGLFTYRREKLIPFTNGVAETDISPALVKMLQLEPIEEDYSVINKRDLAVSGIFFINGIEYWNGGQTNERSIVSYFYGVNNQKKAFELYGSCLAEYEMDLLSNNKFLTRMVKPYYWAGYPFSLGFIYPLKISDKNVYRLEIEQDINESTIQTTSDVLIVANPLQNYEYVNMLTLSGGYTGDSVLVRLTSEATSQFIIPNYATGYANNYFKDFDVPAILLPSIVSELKRVYIGKCFDSPAYLRWRNSLGSFDYWLFGKRQVKDNLVGNFDTFNPLIKDIETEQASELVVTKQFTKRWKLGAMLEMQSLTDIQELFTSPFVQWYNEEDLKWYSVKVLQGTYTYEITDDAMNEVEFSIEFPQEYNQSQ